MVCEGVCFHKYLLKETNFESMQMQVPYIVSGNYVYVAGQIPVLNGEFNIGHDSEHILCNYGYVSEDSSVT